MNLAFMLIVALTGARELVDVHVYPRVVPADFCETFRNDANEVATILAEMKKVFPDIETVSVRCQSLTTEQLEQLSRSLGVIRK